MRWHTRFAAVLIILVIGAALLAGCGGNNQQLVPENVRGRCTYSPDGTRLAFAALGGNFQDYVSSINIYGGDLVVLTPSKNTTTTNDEGGMMPAWAPDNSNLAIISRRQGGQALFLIDPVLGDASRITKLTDDTVNGVDEEPSWSPDSSKIVFISTKATGHHDIFTINKDGTGLTSILATGGDEQYPVYSPDGTKIAFQMGIAGQNGVTDTDIAILDLTTNTVTDITGPNHFRDEAPAWSPDGSTILFQSNRTGGDFDIWAMNPDGSNPRDLTNDAASDGYPVWSPQGNQIAFTRNNELWTMLPDGTGQLQLTRID